MFETPVEECEAAGRPLRVKVIDLGMATQYDIKKVSKQGRGPGSGSA
jgi:hypothetical protein